MLGCVAGIVGDEIVFAGGEHSNRKVSTIVDAAEGHNIRSGLVKKLPALPFPRTKSQSAVVGDKLLVIGG